MRKLTDLPPAPKVLHTLQRLLAEPDVMLEQVAEVVKLEPGLSAKVVRIANSTQFGRGASVDNIVEAIQRVGMNGVQELVTYAVASQLVGRPLAMYRLNAQDLWSRAVACAIAASSLAERSDLNRNDAYTAGLMHGLGLVVIDKHASKQWPARAKPFVTVGYPLDFAAEEREWLGFSHAEAGAALLQLWGFSEAVVTAVKHQLEPEAADAHRPLCMTLATARWARSLFCVPEELVPEIPAETWLEEAGVEIRDFSDWLRKVRLRYTIACAELRLG